MKRIGWNNPKNLKKIMRYTIIKNKINNGRGGVMVARKGDE